MKNSTYLLAIFLFIISLTSACTMLPDGSQIINPISSPAHDTDDNRIDFPPDQLSVTLDNLSLDAGESTEFLIDAKLGETFDMQIETDQGLQFAHASFNPAGELMSRGYSRALDWRSTRTARGDFRVQLTNENESAISYHLRVHRTPFTAEQIKLDGLLAKFNAAGITVAHSASVQRQTEFDKLYGKKIATREILHLTEPQHRVDVYVFANEAIAAEAAALIEPGSHQLTRVTNGTTKIIELYADSGSVPLWWQTGPFILYSARPEPIIAEQIEAVLGDPLGKLAADSVNVRLRNESDTTWQDVTLQWNDESIHIGNLVPGMSGYRELPTAQAVTINATHDGETYDTQIGPLTAGSYMIDLILTEGEMLARSFQDQAYFAAAELIDVTWTWQRVEYADGSTYMPYKSPIFLPTLRFGTDTTTNFGEAGQLYRGNLGCNGMGGLYFANESNDLLVTGGMSTAMLCSTEEINKSEDDGSALLRAARRFERMGDDLHLITLDGDRMIFTPKPETSADTQIYLKIIESWGKINTSFLVVTETKSRPDGISEAEARATIQASFPDYRGAPATTVSDKEMNSFVLRSIENFFLQQTDGSVQIELPNNDVQLISKNELDALFAKDYKNGWRTMHDQYPGVERIFSFSDIGFLDDGVGSMGEKALVYYEVWTQGGVTPYLSLHSKINDIWYTDLRSSFER